MTTSLSAVSLDTLYPDGQTYHLPLISLNWMSRKRKTQIGGSGHSDHTEIDRYMASLDRQARFIRRGLLLFSSRDVSRSSTVVGLKKTVVVILFSFILFNL